MKHTVLINKKGRWGMLFHTNTMKYWTSEFMYPEHFIEIIENDGGYVINQEGIIEFLKKHFTYDYESHMGIYFRPNFLYDKKELNEKLKKIQAHNSVRFINDPN